MAESIHILATNKEEKYRELLPQLEALIGGETNQTANMANICAALKYGMGFFWVGFYLVHNGQLVLGPFQGPVACTRIGRGKGVCGTAWEKKETIVVPDVELFPGHIACSSLSKSEVVIPLLDNEGEVFAVLDVDSDRINDFDTTDSRYLTRITQLLGNTLGV
jgi:L-methionine (R)-S-oxide reductase